MIPRSSTKAMKKILAGAGGVAVPDFAGVSDPRGQRGRRFSLRQLLEWLLCGMLGAFRSLTALEALTARRGQPISDTTFYTLLALLPAEPFRKALHAQGHALDRAKALEPEGLPCPVLTIDNKTLYSGKEPLTADCQLTHLPKSHDVRYHLRTVGAVLTSSPLLPILDRWVIPPETNEMGMFPAFFTSLQQTFGRGLLRTPIVTLDSGFCSLTNATLIDTAGWGYVFALKGNQGGLLEEAQRALAEVNREEPEWTTPWESIQGRQVRRKLYRTDQLRDWETDGGAWLHLRQVWLVVQEERVQVGKVKKGRWGKRFRPVWSEPRVAEERYFLSNLLWHDLKPEQILQVVRGHWGIENGAHWTLDMEWWQEDAAPWCRKQEALMVLALLRAMALNLLRWLKSRHLRNSAVKSMGWKEVFEWVKEVMAGTLVLRLLAGESPSRR